MLLSFIKTSIFGLKSSLRNRRYWFKK